MEMEGMQLRGSAVLQGLPRNPTVQIMAPLELAQIVLFPTHVLGGNATANDGDYLGEPGWMYPKLAVEDVALKMNLEAISIKVEDKDLPLYKSAEFTKAISSWLKLELFEREKRLKF